MLLCLDISLHIYLYNFYSLNKKVITKYPNTGSNGVQNLYTSLPAIWLPISICLNILKISIGKLDIHQFILLVCQRIESKH